MAWTEAEANRGLAGLEDAGCDLAEQPVESSAALTRLASRFAIPIMADESLQGPETAFALARAGAADVFAVKIAQSGGLHAASRVAAIADAAGIGLYGGTMLEGAIGTVASAQLFSTFPKLAWGTELFGPLLMTEELMAEPLEYQNFKLVVPTGAGLGVALDEERLRFFQRDVERRSFSAATARKRRSSCCSMSEWTSTFRAIWMRPRLRSCLLTKRRCRRNCRKPVPGVICGG